MKVTNKLDSLKPSKYNFLNINKNTTASKIFNYRPKPFKVQDLYPNYSRPISREEDDLVSNLKIETHKKNIKTNIETASAVKKSSNVKVAEAEEVQEIELIQNVKIFPNPVQSQLNISFELSNKTSIMLKITDILGNEVMTLMNATLEEGKFTRSFQIAGKINSGTYFVRIIGINSVKVARIILQ